jgi:hypothetical protein
METKIGRVTHFYTHLCVAVLELEREVKVGEVIHVCGRVTDFVQPVESLEIEHKKVQSAGPGSEVALKVDEYVRAGDWVYRVEGD